MLTGTKPQNKGEVAVLARAAQLTSFQWTPLANIPTYTKEIGRTIIPAEIPATGMLYTSAEPTDTFVAENVSFHTLLSAIANPDSVLYHKDLGGHHNAWAYYGVVCNGLVRYALGIRERYSTKHFGDIDGMYKVGDREHYAAEEIALCDVLFAFGHGRNHVAIITDILRDEQGVIRKIEVSEAIRPTCVRAQYDVDEFFEKYKLFDLWRYAHLDMVPPPTPDSEILSSDPKDRVKPMIAVNRGDCANYPLGEKIILSVFREGDSTVEIRCGEQVVETVTVNGYCQLEREFPCGYYTATITETGDSTAFAVVAPHITYTVKDGVITVKAEACDNESRVRHMDFREKTKTALLREQGIEPTEFYNETCASLAKIELLTEQEQESGVIVRAIPADAANFKISFENRYGIWTHPMIAIEGI